MGFHGIHFLLERPINIVQLYRKCSSNKRVKYASLGQKRTRLLENAIAGGNLMALQKCSSFQGLLSITAEWEPEHLSYKPLPFFFPGKAEKTPVLYLKTPGSRAIPLAKGSRLRRKIPDIPATRDQGMAIWGDMASMPG